MSSDPSHEWSGCFSGLLSGSRRQRAHQQAPLQGEGAPLAQRESSPEKALSGELVCAIYNDPLNYMLTMIQPEYVRIASSCDFGSARRESGLPPPYSWTTSGKDHITDALRTIEDTLRELDPELRRLSLDIHGERGRTSQTLKDTDTRFRPS